MQAFDDDQDNRIDIREVGRSRHNTSHPYKWGKQTGGA